MPRTGFVRGFRGKSATIVGDDDLTAHPFPMLSFSTCWNSSRHTDGDVMLREIKELGFDEVELGHGIRISLMPGIQQMYDAGKVKFTSLHNFCPLPVEVMPLLRRTGYLLSTSYAQGAQ